ncbi:MAG: nucleotidyltransferase domain-containing protein [Coxiellaceae bacterium]|nr:nucleotidyltransferase domain-containing protein [Coxiellaceae bacterium]
MRLSDHEIQAIKQAVAAVDATAVVYLFGSRTDLNKKGGDIDLLVLSDSVDIMGKIKIRRLIVDQIGDQKIDILVSQDPHESAFVEHAIETGVKLE